MQRLGVFCAASLLACLPSATTAQSWQPLTNGLPPNARIQAIAADGTRLFIGVGTVGSVGIYTSTDNGDSWTKTADGPFDPIYADANALLVTSNVVLASRLVAAGELFRSTNNGVSWQLASGFPSDGGIVCLARDGTTFYAQVYNYGPYRSTDGGATWTPAYSGLTGIPQRIGAMNGRVFSSQLQSGLWMSADQGNSWTKVQPEIGGSNFPPSRMTVQANKLFVGVSGSLAPSVISVTDGSSTWQAADGGLVSSFSEKDFAAGANAVFVAGQNGSAPSIWQSLDAGGTWQELTASGLNNAPSSITPVSCVWVQGNALFASTIAINGTNGFYRLALNNGIYNQAPSFLTQPAAQTVGSGQSVMFSATALGQGPFSYQWRSNGVNLAGATSSTLTLKNVTTNFAAAYSALVWNAWGTNASTNALLTVLSTAPGNVDFNFAVAPMGTDLSGYVLGGAVNAVAIQPDGRILTAGNFNRVGGSPGSPYPSGGVLCSNIARYLPDGSLDFSFQLTNGANGQIKALALQADGKILIGGQFTSYKGVARNRLARLNSDGTLDTNFLATTSGFDGDVNAIAVQLDGRILVGGNFSTVNGTNRAYLARLLTTGDYDTNFLNGMTGPAAKVLALTLSSNRIYAAGSFTSFNGATRGRLARLLDTGALDTSFDSTNGFNGDVNALTVQPDGKVVCVGGFTTYRGTNTVRIARVTSTGAFDYAFGTGLNQIPYAAITQPDGKVIVAGNFTTANSTNRTRLVRFHSDGTLDMDFDPSAGANSQINALALLSDGQLIIGGAFTTVNGQPRYLLARMFAAPLATPPPLLQFSSTGLSLQFNWTGNFVLQSNGLLQSTGWVTIPGTPPVSIPTSAGANGFFRLAPAP